MDSRNSSCQSNYRSAVSQNPTRTSSVAATSHQRPSRRELMDKINHYSFAMNEANLFLDTHPYDAEALNFFQKHRDLRTEALKEYAKYYAPLVIDYTVCDKTPWSWAQEPWPWEGVEC